MSELLTMNTLDLIGPEPEVKRAEEYLKMKKQLEENRKLNEVLIEKVTKLDSFPRVVLVPGVGMFAFGMNRREAGYTAEFYRNAIRVMAGACALGGGDDHRDAARTRLAQLELRVEQPVLQLRQLVLVLELRQAPSAQDFVQHEIR